MRPRFLARKSGVKPFPGATYIAQRYRRFTEVLPGAASAAKVTIDELRTLKYLPDLVNLMVTFEPQGPAFVRFGRPNHEPPEIAFDLLFGALIEPVEQRFSSVAQRASPPLRTA